MAALRRSVPVSDHSMSGPTSWVKSSAIGRRDRIGVVTILANTALMNVGFTMLIPIISVYFTTEFAMTGAAVGSVLAVRQFAQQGLMMFGGAFGDRWGHKPIICAGYLVRAFGFVGFAYSTTLPALFASAVVAALGGALFEATSKAALASLVPPDRRAGVFSLAALCGGVGLAIGPLVGVALLNVGFLWVGLGAAGCFFVAALVTLLLMPATRTAAGASGPVGVRASLGVVVRDRQFVVFTALLVGFWFLNNQIYISVPLLAVRLTHDTALVGAIFASQAVAAILLQVPLTRLASRYLAPPLAIALGLLLMGGGLGLMAVATSGAALVACALAFAVGRVVVEPIKDTLTANMADPSGLAAYFGFGFLALAVGGTAGNYLGGWLMDLALAPSLVALPWVTFAVIGLVSALGMAAFRVRSRVAATPAGALADERSSGYRERSTGV